MANITTETTTSRDGTTIGYRRLGVGPGLVILHGSMESSASHVELAEALADSYTAYLPDRRGRGMSGPYSANYEPAQDVEDLAAVMNATGSRIVMGVSSGAVIALNAALELPSLRTLVAFEPALFLNAAEPRSFFDRFERQVAAGDVAGSLVTGMKGAQMGPAIFNLIPEFLLRRLTNMAMAGQEKKAKPGDITMRMLAPTLHYDFDLITRMSGSLDRYRAITAETLLLGGSKSPAYLRTAVRALEDTIPGARRIEIEGANHSATGNAAERGQPERVAEVLRRFLSPNESRIAPGEPVGVA